MTKTILILAIAAAFVAGTITTTTLANAALPSGQPFQMLDQRITMLEQNDRRSDSFFDVFFDVFSNPQSFFDIFTELRAADAQLQSNIDAVKPICPSNNVQHWDKIVFKFKFALHVDPLNPSDPSLDTGRTYDIKVLDNPALVADINQKINDFLRAHYNIAATDEELVGLIEVVNVEYAIVCAGT